MVWIAQWQVENVCQRSFCQKAKPSGEGTVHCCRSVDMNSIDFYLWQEATHLEKPHLYCKRVALQEEIHSIWPQMF